MAKQTALPPSLAPRLVVRLAAAAYVSVSPTIFDEMVADGRMPHARRLSPGRVAWDVRELDVAIDVLPTDGPSGVNPTWEDEDAKEITHAH